MRARARNKIVHAKQRRTPTQRRTWQLFASMRRSASLFGARDLIFVRALRGRRLG